MSVSSDGFTVGQCAGLTISGNIVYKNNDIQLNAFITLYRKLADGTLKVLHQWVMKSCAVVENSLQFSGQDVSAYLDNSYQMVGTVGEQFQKAKEELTILSGITIDVDIPSAAATKNTEGETGWSIRDLFSYGSMLNAANYAVEISEFGKAKFSLTSDYLEIGQDDYSALTKGFTDVKISEIDIFKSNMEMPTLLSNGQTAEGKTLESMGIYIIRGSEEPKPSGVLRLVCPLADPNVTTNVSLTSLIGKSFGAEASCETVKVDRFLPPMCQIKFVNETATYYVMNADYKLTTKGIYTSVSCNGRQISDFEYIGMTEKDLQRRVELNVKYNGFTVSQEIGAVWDDSGVGEATNSG